MDEFEVGGLFFYYDVDNNTYDIEDYNYGMHIGRILCEEGPGWILELDLTPFLDTRHLVTLADIVSELSMELS